MALNILICDDSKFSRKRVRAALEESWIGEIHEAEDGDQALEVCRSEALDLILLDLTMPIMDGFQLLAALDQEDIRPTVIVISADVQEGARARALELGAAEFIPKPFDKPKLQGTLQRLGLI